jgi:homoserine kinase
LNPVQVSVRVPASVANLGPGFDCLALALDLWNQADFSVLEDGLILDVEGEGQDTLPHDGNNLVAQAAVYLFQSRGSQVPKGLVINCHNSIPLGSGMGSSASASLLGLLGANALLGSPLTYQEILQMAFEIEGHPDNAAAALYGGLAMVTPEEEHLISRSIPVPPIQLVIALPDVTLPTRVARAILPDKVPFKDAVFNCGHIPLVVEALRTGDLDLLGAALQDRLHQPYRLPLIKGADRALQAACNAGAVATGISGAGPGLFAFIRDDPATIQEAVRSAFRSSGITCRTWVLESTNQGAQIS